MAQDQIVYGTAEDSEKFRFFQAHRTQERIFAARTPDLIVPRQINRKPSHPVRFL